MTFLLPPCPQIAKNIDVMAASGRCGGSKREIIEKHRMKDVVNAQAAYLGGISSVYYNVTEN